MNYKKNNKFQNITLNGQCISGDTECNLETIGHILKKMHELDTLV